MAQTPLERELGGTRTAARPTPLDALATADKWFKAGRKLDIQALAGELGVSRVTLHRWIGTRERLLVEVLWRNADRALSRLATQVEADRPACSHTAEVLSRWVVGVLDNPGIRQLQAEEGEMLARLLTHDASEFQSRMIERVAELLSADIEHRRVTIDLDVTDLAYTTVRIVESFVHTSAITGGRPDPERNARVLRAILR
ncbi:hypothetical protein GCM10022222_34220 [Amycolatopsis ultiminotia]|uniref:QsdR TetR regulatory C-terminal domain-containing protein n=1 Tax=Amycolatopsis ultiminotia TaxID=543629 RepID=A0ABP6WBW0_9PSEU